MRDLTFAAFWYSAAAVVVALWLAGVAVLFVGSCGIEEPAPQPEEQSVECDQNSGFGPGYALGSLVGAG